MSNERPPSALEGNEPRMKIGGSVDQPNKVVEGTKGISEMEDDDQLYHFTKASKHWDHEG